MLLKWFHRLLPWMCQVMKRFSQDLIIIPVTLGCQIKKISARAFHNIEQLERLYLHNNKIEEVKTLFKTTIEN